MTSVRDTKTGKLIESDDPLKDARNREKNIAKEMGYTIKKQIDYLYEMRDLLESSKLKSYKRTKKKDEFGFSKDFYHFLGIKDARNYKYDLTYDEKVKLNLRADTANYFSPVENFWDGTPSGGDPYSDWGRVPVSHLVALCSQRLGICHRATNGTASDIFRNKFDFVRFDDPDKKKEFPRIFKWMRDSKFWDHIVNLTDMDLRTGLSHLIRKNKGEKTIDWDKVRSNKKIPDSFESWSCYYMTPINITEVNEYSLDYAKDKWRFRGGIVSPATIHESRVYSLEIYPFEGGLRGISLPELCYVPLMCYLNTMYYILKDLSTMGVMMASINTESPFPTTLEFQAYLDLWGEMEANNLFVLGKNATFNPVNMASRIGAGIESYLEFLREDISSAWIIPKNQLFGRAEGGGLEGAGAIISKEDYLASNISAKQLTTTNDIMSILVDFCGWSELEDYTLDWKIDLHKSEEQRLKEQMMREQVKQAQIQTENMELLQKLSKKQVDLQIQMADIQTKMMKTDPQAVFNQSNKDEENIKEKGNPKANTSDFVNLRKQYDFYLKEYLRNQEHMKFISTIIRKKILEKNRK